MSAGLKAERLFADLCNLQFLHGFVFHSPRFYDPTEKEAGDVVLWVRRQVVVVELLTREAEAGASTKQYVKRIGEKRRQLIEDYKVFTDPKVDVHLINEQGEEVYFDTRDLGVITVSGIILLDCDAPLEKPHFKSIERILCLPFPGAVMTRQDFLDLTFEIDTIPDLTYYLADRASFMREVYSQNPQSFLDLNRRLERNLIAFYKLNENSFPASQWQPAETFNYHQRYHRSLRERITVRDTENLKSGLIDELIDILRSHNKPEDSTLLHSWELASLTRRQRAAISPKVADAIEKMRAGNPSRHFAFFNQATGCWIVFYFQYGGERSAFAERTVRLTQQKLLVEVKQSDFIYSVFGYGFRKSLIHTGSTFDGIKLVVKDAADHRIVSDDEYQEALQYFERGKVRKLTEFPDGDPI